MRSVMGKLSSKEHKKVAVSVMGIYRVDQKIHIDIIGSCSWNDMKRAVEENLDCRTIISDEEWEQSYEIIKLLAYDRVFRINYDKEGAYKNVVLDESMDHEIMWFCNFLRRRLKKFRGTNKNALLLHIKETEFRFNNRGRSLYTKLLTSFRKKPL